VLEGEEVLGRGSGMMRPVGRRDDTLGEGSLQVGILPPIFGVNFPSFLGPLVAHDLHVYTGLVGLDAPF
jgi:hypothetical protein